MKIKKKNGVYMSHPEEFSCLKFREKLESPKNQKQKVIKRIRAANKLQHDAN